MKQARREKTKAVVSMDLGGRALRMGIVQFDVKGGLHLLGDVEEGSSPKSWEEFVDVAKGYQAKASNPEGFGVAIAGAIECHAKVIKAPNLPWLDGHDVPQELAPHVGLKPEQIVVANDMEAAAYGEKEKGVLSNYTWAIFDTISTGWGGALILNGEVVVGEPGHVNLGFDLSYACGCGNRGCVEALYSGSAIERRILQYLQDQKILFPPSLNVWDYFYKELETEAEWAVSLLAEWAEGVGRAWANVLNRIRSIQAIVYMGTTAERLIPKTMDRIRATMWRICMFPKHKEIPIEKAREPNRSIYGAVLVHQEVQKKRGEEGGGGS